MIISGMNKKKIRYLLDNYFLIKKMTIHRNLLEVTRRNGLELWKFTILMFVKNSV